jgi:hypothetical protein
MREGLPEIIEEETIENDSVETPEGQEQVPDRNWHEASTLFNSEDFLETLSEFPEEKREYALGEVMEYIALFDDTNGAEEFLNTLKDVDFENTNKIDNEIDELFVRAIAKRLNIDDIHSVENKSKIFTYFKDRYKNNGYYFHGFNGVFEDDIARDGIDTDKRKWDWSELKRITEIGEKAGQKMLLGWGNLNSESTSFVSTTAKNSYRYAVASPEWFAQFVGEGFHVPEEGKRKKAFYLRDYDQARQNVLDVCEKMMSSKEEDIANKKSSPNISPEEKEEIMSFFEKYWKIFTGEKSKPKLALINRSLFGTRTDHSTLEEFCERIKKDIDSIDVSYALGILKKRSSVDVPIQINMPSDEIKIIDLPEYISVHPEYIAD